MKKDYKPDEDGHENKMKNTIINSECLTGLKNLSSGIVNTIVTSPPYFGLRDYGADGQIGLEPTPQDFVDALVQVFREARRVLRDDGTLWLNLGDTYNAYNGNRGSAPGANKNHHKIMPSIPRGFDLTVKGLKNKDLIGIPWRVAFALQADGWYLRQDIIWAKKNCMPESVRDRCTKSHEYIFLLSKNPKYYFDYKAIKEPCAEVSKKRAAYKWNCDRPSTKNNALGDKPGIHVEEMANRFVPADGRNKRDVWWVATRSCKEAHFATFPHELIRPCILAGAPINGLVLDPFMGAGTTAVVAKSEGRNYLGFEINPQYILIAEKRIAAVSHPLDGLV